MAKEIYPKTPKDKCKDCANTLYYSDETKSVKVKVHNQYKPEYTYHTAIGANCAVLNMWMYGVEECEAFKSKSDN